MKRSTRERDEPRLGMALRALRAVWALDHALHRASRRMESAHGVTGPQRLAVRMIGRFPGISAGRLAELLHVHPSTLTGVLVRLQRRGLVSRRADPRDGRRVVLALTPAGRAVDARHHGTIEALVEKALRRLAVRDVVATERVLAELTRELTGASR